ncbi:transcriptional regulator, TetR family [Chitinophaga jiangningensis]|uniref:Transcriptional regulator, TetR family n=1 Tax=Chitinophaga jiangningensis TaxID=1419482 RepID=A0A1M7J6U4_9BACT|nr:TetR/AcrR family transcriptional regulator [Chitinophaga jiangningensis]SHM48601.1 transcriptional regulator, TetR family [Chitinophaga jiangningensis]
MSSGKRDIIIQTAQQLFHQSGMGAVTMEEIARVAGMGKSTMYYYFKSKEEIFNAALEVEINDIVLMTIKAISSKDTLPEQLLAFAMVKYEMSRKRKALYKVTETGMDSETLSKYIDIKKANHHQYLIKEKTVMQQLLSGAIHRRELRALNKTEMDQAILIFLSSLRGINREIILHGTDLEPADTIAAFCELFYKGLR